RKRSHRCEPRKPAAPVISTRSLRAGTRPLRRVGALFFAGTAFFAEALFLAGAAFFAEEVLFGAAARLAVFLVTFLAMGSGVGGRSCCAGTVDGGHHVATDAHIMETVRTHLVQ